MTNDSGYITDSALTGLQTKNVGVEKKGNILTVAEDGNITTSATIEQGKVAGLEEALAGKASIEDVPTTVAELTDASDYVTTTKLTEGLATKQDSLGYTAENTANKRIVVRDSGTATDTDYPSEKAVRTELDKKADKGSTLAEYGITDAYTKNETDTKISEAVTGSIEGDDSYNVCAGAVVGLLEGGEIVNCSTSGFTIDFNNIYSYNTKHYYQNQYKSHNSILL